MLKLFPINGTIFSKIYEINSCPISINTDTFPSDHFLVIQNKFQLEVNRTSIR